MNAPSTRRFTKEAFLIAGIILGWFGQPLATDLVNSKMKQHSKRVKFVCPQPKATRVLADNSIRVEYVVDLKNIGNEPAINAHATFQSEYGMRLKYAGFVSEPPLARDTMRIDCDDHNLWDKITCRIGELDPGQHIYFYFIATSSSEIPTSTIPTSTLDTLFSAPGFSQISSRLSPGPSGAPMPTEDLENAKLTPSSFLLPTHKSSGNRTQTSTAGEQTHSRANQVSSNVTAIVGCIIPARASGLGGTTLEPSTTTAAVSGSEAADVNGMTHSDATAAMEQDSVKEQDNGSGSNPNRASNGSLSSTTAGNGLQRNGSNASEAMSYASVNSDSPSSSAYNESPDPQAASESLNVKIDDSANGQISANTSVSVTPVAASGVSAPIGCDEKAAGTAMKVEVPKSGGAQLVVTGTATEATKNNMPVDDKGQTCKQ